MHVNMAIAEAQSLHALTYVVIPRLKFLKQIKYFLSLFRKFTPYITEQHQNEFCHRHPTLMHKVSMGVKSAIKECQFQFK